MQKDDRKLVLPETVEECHAMIINLVRQIESLRQRAFSSLKDRAVKYDGPSLFEEFDKEDALQRAEALKKAAEEVDAHAAGRRARANKETKSTRPQKYNTCGLEERITEKMPEGIDPSQYDEIKVEEKRILHYEAPKMWVEVVRVHTMRHKEDKGMPSPRIIQSEAPRPIIGGGHVAADMLAAIAVNKFCYHLPEYRQISMFADLGLKLPTSTVNNWIHAVANVLYPLYESQLEAILAGKYLQVDEVPWNIADRRGKPCRKGYAWQFRDVSRHSRGTYFYYYKGSRRGEIPRTQLRGYKGVIQSDGYKVYEQFESIPGITTLACMAHVRRKFVEAQKSNPLAGEAVKIIATLYTLEANLKESGATEEEILAERQRLAVPILDGLEAWMSAALLTCLPKEPLANAIGYAQNLWSRLKRYTEDGSYHIDSNPVERGQRPTVLGRKNYLFSQNDSGAEDNAVFYTMFVSCDILGVNPLKWLRNALENLRPGMEETELQALLPYNYKADL